jgi:hypothetical protein
MLPLQWLSSPVILPLVTSHESLVTNHQSLLQRFQLLPLDLPVLLDAPGHAH